MDFPVKKFLSYYKPYWKPFLAVLCCALLISGVALIFPLLVRYMTKDLLQGEVSLIHSQIYWIGALMLALVAVQNVANYYLDYKGHEIGARMEGDLREELFDHMQKLPFSFFDKEKTGQLMSRITNDLLLVSELYHHGPEDYVKYFVRFVGAFIILFFINAPMTIAVFCFIPVLAVFSVYFNKVLNRALTRNKENIARINEQVEDSLAGIRVVQSFANERFEMKKFRRENERFLKSRCDTYRAEAYYYNGVETLIQLITVTVVLYGSASILNQTLDLADLITFLLYITYMVEPIQRLTHMSTQFQEGVTGFQRFMEIMNQEPAIQNRPEPVQLNELSGRIEFQDVMFRYEESLAPVLSGLSLQVRPGEYVAVVGPSGAGKTTLCSLIPRFYDVQGGRILIDGHDIRDVDLATLRNQIGIVQQDVYLFSGTVMDNIRYGREDATEEEVMEAAKKAHAHEFIMQLPQEYHSEIGQRGVKLSGGQKQRLSIARVFLKNPPILIFDEATSALDHESERMVKDSLELLAAGRTTIVIAHRLSTIQNAERILVMTREGVVEQGTHHELLQKRGTYAALYAGSYEMQV